MLFLSSFVFLGMPRWRTAQDLVVMAWVVIVNLTYPTRAWVVIERKERKVGRITKKDKWYSYHVMGLCRKDVMRFQFRRSVTKEFFLQHDHNQGHKLSWKTASRFCTLATPCFDLTWFIPPQLSYMTWKILDGALPEKDNINCGAGEGFHGWKSKETL